METNYRRTRLTCFFTNIAISSVFSVPPVLFMTFHTVYGISYTLLGTLVAINFITQLTIDLIFSFFTKYFNIPLTVRIMPLLTTAGLAPYALIPLFFPEHAYTGLVIGTVIFSVSAGLSEVLISPTVAAMPSEHPDRDMSLLHSLYGWGVLFNVLLATLYVWLFGAENWQYLILFLAILPLIASILFFLSPMPPMTLSHPVGKGSSKVKRIGILLCIACIFLGSATENVMTNWISGFAEHALGIPKLWGDIFGLALFALFLSVARTLYAKFGKKIEAVMLYCMISSIGCYLLAALSPNDTVALIAAALTGVSASMLWPGTLILMEEKMPGLGVVAYALMAAGGDFGASVAPQLVGVIVDSVSLTELAKNLAASLATTPDAIGLKTGMLVTAIFPTLGILLLLCMRRFFKKNKFTE